MNRVLIACLLLTGCATKHAYQIPKDCMKVRITDFTQPCETLPDGNLMCDRVRVHINCTQAK